MLSSQYLIILAIVVVFIFYYGWQRTYAEGFSATYQDDYTPQKFGQLRQHIGWNNGLSWDNLPNPYLDQTLKGRRSPVIPLGYGFPLTHEEHPTVPVKNSMYYFENYACRPECCLTSPFSCSKGCICWTPPKELDNPVRRNEKITPSS